MKHNFLMTTSPSFEGLAVEAYLGVVTSNVVTGTGLFSDIAASFSDFFGGRSNAYKAQLDSIRDEAIAELETKARMLGANAVVALSIDNDQISGKNTQMLMITITATAVKLNLPDNESSYHVTNRAKRLLTTDEVTQLVRLKNLEASTESMALERLFKEYQDVFTNIPNIAVARVLVKRLLNLHYEAESIDQGLSQLIGYLSVFSNENLQSVVYEEVNSTEYSTRTLKQLRFLTTHFDLYDHDNINALFGSGDSEKSLSGLLFCRSKQSFYDSSDIERIEKTVEKIKDTFPIKREITERKKSLGRISQVWTCKNGHENESDKEVCLHCQLTRRDTPKFLYEEAIEELTNRVKALRVAFSSQS